MVKIRSVINEISLLLFLFLFVFVIVVVADLINDFVVVVVDPRSLPLKSGQNRVGNG